MTEWSDRDGFWAESALAALLRQAGFASVDRFGSFEGTPYDPTAKMTAGHAPELGR